MNYYLFLSGESTGYATVINIKKSKNKLQFVLSLLSYDRQPSGAVYVEYSGFVELFSSCHMFAQAENASESSKTEPAR